MENEKSGQNGFHGRASGPPFTSATQAKTPLISSRPLAGAEASRFGAVQQPRFSGPTILPPQASYPPAVVGFDTRFQTPQFPSPDRPRPTMTRLPFQLSTGQQPMSQSVPNSPQPYIPSVPMRPPQRNMNPTLSRGNTHPSASPPLQSTTQGYSYKQPDPVQVLPPQNHPFLAHQGGPAPLHPPPQNPHFSAQQGGYAPGPPLPQNPPFIGQGGYTPHYPPPGTNLGVQMQPPSGGAPVGAIQGLVENFSSLSVGSSPGSIGPGIDIKALPRPLDGDTVPKILTEMFPSNCDSRFFRLTTSAIPNSKSLLSRWHLPLGAVVQPLAEAPDGEEIPTVNFGSAGIVRCRRCRIYVNPYVTFTDGGRKWRCNLCALFNDVPGDYFAPLDASGRRSDLDQRPELTKGSVEFVAPTEYMMRPPMPPLYFFLIDVSVTAARNGMLEIVAKTIKSCLDELPGSSRTQIGFLTFDSTLHFYNMRSSMSQPQMMVMSDLEDIFVPLPDDLLVNLSESRNVVDSFLDSLPSMFQDNVNVESAFGPALKAASMVMGLLGGKLLIFQTTLPSLGVGRLRLRGNDPHLYGTDKEHASRVPEEPFYKQMAADLTKYQIGANVYAFSEKYTDLASLGTLAKYTGGQVYYYPGFQVDTHGEKLRYELARDLTRETAWESVLCIRCGKGVRFTTFHGHFMLRSTDLLALPAVDCDKAFGAQLSLDDQLLINQTVYFQVALLYVSKFFHVSTYRAAYEGIIRPPKHEDYWSLEIPPRRQTLMYTATWPKEVRKIAADLLVNPVQVNIGSIDELVANKSITQIIEVVTPMEKTRRLDQLSRSITRQFGAAAIHGDKSQTERDYVLNQFRSGKSPILVATDVAARGLDIKDIRYSSSAGERRIRVHTAAVPVVTDLSEMYRQADIGAIVTLLGRLAIEKTLSDRLEVARQFVQLKIVNALKEYRNLYAMQHRLGGKIIYPESLKYLVLYGLALCKSLPLRGGYADVHLDERCASGFTMMIMSVKRLLKLLYPNLARIDDYLLKAPAEADDFGKFLQKLPLSSQNLDSRGLYIYDDGLRFIIWFGGNLSDDVAKSILGEDLSGIPDFSRVYLSEQGNQISRKIIYLVKKLRESDPSNYQICHLVRQGDQPSEISFLLGNLTEDQIGGTSSYVDWMLQIHRQVQNS